MFFKQQTFVIWKPDSSYQQLRRTWTWCRSWQACLVYSQGLPSQFPTTYASKWPSNANCSNSLELYNISALHANDSYCANPSRCNVYAVIQNFRSDTETYNLYHCHLNPVVDMNHSSISQHEWSIDLSCMEHDSSGWLVAARPAVFRWRQGLRSSSREWNTSRTGGGGLHKGFKKPDSCLWSNAVTRSNCATYIWVYGHVREIPLKWQVLSVIMNLIIYELIQYVRFCMLFKF